MAKKLKKSAKATGLEITPIDTGTEPARESEAPVPAPTTGIADPLGEPADGEGRTYLGDKDVLEESAPEPEIVEVTDAEAAADLEAQTPKEEIEEDAAAGPQK